MSKVVNIMDGTTNLQGPTSRVHEIIYEAVRHALKIAQPGLPEAGATPIALNAAIRGSHEMRGMVASLWQEKDTAIRHARKFIRDVDGLETKDGDVIDSADILQWLESAFPEEPQEDYRE